MVAPAFATIALFLLAASGVAKLLDPEPTTGAMRAARLPASNLLSYLLGVAEILVSSLALMLGGMSIALAALLYLCFTAFTFAATRNRIPVQSCGCFGRDDTPPSMIHVAFNLIATAALLACFFLGPPPVDWTTSAMGLLLYLGFGIIGAYASFLLLARLPQVLSLVRTN